MTLRATFIWWRVTRMLWRFILLSKVHSTMEARQPRSLRFNALRVFTKSALANRAHTLCDFGLSVFCNFSQKGKPSVFCSWLKCSPLSPAFAWSRLADFHRRASRLRWGFLSPPLTAKRISKMPLGYQIIRTKVYDLFGEFA
jgi:hypothetical protein